MKGATTQTIIKDVVRPSFVMAGRDSETHNTLGDK